MVKLVMKIAGIIHKYIVVFLFFLSYFFCFCSYTDWYANYFDYIECLTTGSVSTSLYFFCSGFVRRKCMWFKTCSFGLLFNSVYNLLDLHYNFNAYMVVIYMTATTFILGVVLYYFLNDLKEVDL